MNHGILTGAASSGSGKTTFTMGLLRALRNRNLRVQPYKCGPDYIDPIFHRLASGRESVNLDTFLASPQHVRDIYSHYASDADICVTEGVMGLFDGYDRARGSSAEIATLLRLPVVLLVNAQSTAYSVAPLIHGFKTFSSPSLGSMPVNLGGVVFNKVGSEKHFRFLKSACEDAGVACLGYLSRNSALNIPSRHLGLTISICNEMERLIALAAEEVEAHVDIAAILGMGEESAQPTAPQPVCRGTLRIAVARDEAFNFTYRANLDALASLGTICFFSPLRDAAMPPCDLLYLPGGYPELFADRLAANASMRESISRYVEHDGRVLAECGGFMYLCRDIDGQPMCGIFPFSASMADARLHLGYRQLRCGETTVCGHEFHYSRCIGMPDENAVYRYRNVMAGYPHWYWAETGLERLWNAN